MSLLSTVAAFRAGFLCAGLEPPTAVLLSDRREWRRFLRLLESETQGMMCPLEDLGEIRLMGITFKGPAPGETI